MDQQYKSQDILTFRPGKTTIIFPLIILVSLGYLIVYGYSSEGIDYLRSSMLENLFLLIVAIGLIVYNINNRVIIKGNTMIHQNIMRKRKEVDLLSVKRVKINFFNFVMQSEKQFVILMHYPRNTYKYIRDYMIKIGNEHITGENRMK